VRGWVASAPVDLEGQQKKPSVSAPNKVMSKFKPFLITAIICLAAVAVASRVKVIGDLVFNRA